MSDSLRACTDARRRPRVLYVDDERPNLTTFKYEFRDAFDIQVAESGEEALEILERMDICVLIADQRMPGMQGTDLLERARVAHPRAIRMILTGYSDFGALIDAINRGSIYYYFSKPWKGEELRLVIANAVESLRLERKLEESERRFRETFEQLTVGLAHANLDDGRFVLTNQRFRESLCIDAEDGGVAREGMTLWAALGVDPGEARSSLAGEETRLARRTRVRRADGTALWGLVELAVARDESGAPQYYIVALQEITDLVTAEEELRKHRDELEERVRERTAEVLEANASLRAQKEELETFNRAMVDREMKVIELKEGINRLHEQLGKEPPYPAVWNEDG